LRNLEHGGFGGNDGSHDFFGRNRYRSCNNGLNNRCCGNWCCGHWCCGHWCFGNRLSSGWRCAGRGSTSVTDPSKRRSHGYNIVFVGKNLFEDAGNR
jgi:hypothetical protein